MKACHTLICFIFLTLQEGNACNISEDGLIYTKEGEDITIGFSFSVSGSRKFFCKDECEEGNILIETTEDRAQRDRYRLRYTHNRLLSMYSLYVSITQLEISDSGRYRCSLDRPSHIDSYRDFEIIVTEAGSSAPSTITERGSLLVVVVCVPVVVIVLLLPVVLLLIYRKKTEDSVCFNRRGNSEHSRTEVALYENCPPVSTCEDSTYQSLSPATRDYNQTYCTLTEIA